MLDTQPLDAVASTFANVTNNSFEVSWTPVAYEQTGGYRVYMAEQIDSETGSNMTDFVQIAELGDKILTSTMVANLAPCRQYFIKVLSFTHAHEDNVNDTESDGVSGSIMGTIPGFSPECKLVGSPFHDIFKLSSGGDTVENIRVSIAVEDSGARAYEIIYPGADIIVGSINGAAGSDDITIVTENSIAVSLNSIISAGTITIDSSFVLDSQSIDLNSLSY